MTEEDFLAIKELLYRGESPAEIRSVTGRGIITVHLTEISQTFAEFREATNDYFTKRITMSQLRIKRGFTPQGSRAASGTPALYDDAGKQFADLLRTIVLILKQ